MINLTNNKQARKKESINEPFIRKLSQSLNNFTEWIAMFLFIKWILVIRVLNRNVILIKICLFYNFSFLDM